MIFKKYPSIDNIEIAKRTSRDYQFMHTLKCRWVVTEKIDGTNIGICITRTDWSISKRNSMLGKGASFYNVYQSATKMLYPFIEAVQQLYLANHPEIEQITFCGEYFGSKVINRIYYGCEYDFRFFDSFFVKDDNIVWNSFQHTENILKDLNFSTLLVPVLGIFNNLSNAEDYPNDNITMFADDKHHDKMEGIVIRPYEYAISHDNHDCIIKNKNADFLEKHCSSKAKKECESVEENELKQAKEIFKSYCTESRMVSLFSKEGLPQNEKKDTGKYLKIFVDDMCTDFYKEHPEYISLTDSEKRFITNLGSDGYIIYKVVLETMKNAQ